MTDSTDSTEVPENADPDLSLKSLDARVEAVEADTDTITDALVAISESLDAPRSEDIEENSENIAQLRRATLAILYQIDGIDDCSDAGGDGSDEEQIRGFQ